MLSTSSISMRSSSEAVCTVVQPEQQQAELSTKVNSQWEQLREYTKNHPEAFLLKFWVKQTSGEYDDELSRFQSLFDKMKKNLFGSTQFFNSTSLSDLTTDYTHYTRAEKSLRDFDLMIFWQHLQKENSEMNLPSFENADQIRIYLDTTSGQDRMAQITSLNMPGIFEIWPELHQEHQVPSFKTEREMHNYLENPENGKTIGAIVVTKRDWIISNTTRLPPEIRYLKNLKEFIFSNRKGVVFPKEVFELKKLERLDARHSEIEKLSKRIGNLGQLQKLCIRGSLFSQLPERLLNLIAAKIRVENKTEMNLSCAMQVFSNKEKKMLRIR